VDAISGQVGSALLVTHGAVGGLIGGSAIGTADPYIFVDPSFPSAANFRVIVSDGIGNIPNSSVPEPATIVLLGLGLATFGCSTRRQTPPV
jgi:hypothetical protein